MSEWTVFMIKPCIDVFFWNKFEAIQLLLMSKENTSGRKEEKKKKAPL